MPDVLHNNNLVVFLILLAAVGAVVGLFVGLTVLFGPKRPGEIKNAPFESGWITKTDATQPFPIKYYLVAILFVVFDIEVAFLYPWAVSFRDNGMLAFVSMNVFLAILMVGLYYAIKKRVLEWK